MTRLHHTNIRIADPARSLQFYRTLGFKHLGTAALAPGYTLLFLGTDPDQATLELVVNENVDETYDRSPGAGHLGIEVDDLNGALAALGELGVEPEAPPAHPLGRTDLNPVAFVRDPDGVRVELLQAPWPLPQDTVPDELAEL